MSFLSRIICRSPICSRYRRMTTACNPVIPPWKTQNSSSPSPPPWLMLPPSFDNESRSLSYNFYSLADNKVLTLPQTKLLKHLMPNPIHHLTFCGSSHGWIAMCNPQTLDLFIYNPITLRHITLPPIPNKRSLRKLILSCSPDDDEESCRAVIMYNCVDALAVCCPGLTKKWTQIGMKFHANGERKGNYYNDIVYSSRQNLFFGLKRPFCQKPSDLSEIETWDFTDLSFPLLVKKINTGPRPSLFDDSAVQPEPDDYLVVADDDVLLVTRYEIGEVALDGSFIDYDYPTGHWSCAFDPSVYPIQRKPPGLYPLVTKLSDFSFYPQMTVGFYIKLYDQKVNVLSPGVPSLGDRALFIGSCSDSVALSAARFPELKSNSVYFTHPLMETGDSDEIFGGHDIGIFDFESKTVSPCYYPCDRPNLKKIVPSPIWFFPRLH